MWSKEFWLDLLERAVKSAAQYAVLAWGAVAFTAVGQVVSAVQAVGLAVVFGFGLSALTSIASAKIGSAGTASVLPEVTYVDPDPGDAP